MYGLYDYYLNLECGVIKEWSNDKFVVMSWEDWLIIDFIIIVEKIIVFILMIYFDGVVLLDYIKVYFECIGSVEKELYWMFIELDFFFY